MMEVEKQNATTSTKRNGPETIEQKYEQICFSSCILCSFFMQSKYTEFYSRKRNEKSKSRDSYEKQTSYLLLIVL